MGTLSLAGEWQLRCVTARQDMAAVAMRIPGDNYTALMQAHVIPDPYYARNEGDVQWVGKEDWEISRNFSFSKEEGSRCYLCMDMVDTYFTVLINGKQAAEGHNYFRIWRFDVTDFVRDGENSIAIRFASAERKAGEAARQLPYPIPYTKYDVFSPHRNLSRKIQCHSGWDWGPCLMVCGIYGSITLQPVRSGSIRALTVTTEPEEPGNFGGSWKVCVDIHYHAEREGTAAFRIGLENEGGACGTGLRAEYHAVPGGNTFSAQFSVRSPALWHSADELKELGQAENTLYTLRVSTDESRMSKQIAFRTLRLRAEKDSYGCSLFYELNGRALFAKGANWIPADALPSRWTEARCRYLLEASSAANMNTIRVWGGGQYESDSFYTLCDRLGLIVWQDCAFACSLYPSGEEFLHDVEQELEDNILRLQSHPSLAVWCGNNENLGALTWYEESRKNRDRYITDYDRLNHGTVEKTVRRCDPWHTWWPSSPCAGPDTFGDNWHNDSEGDMHFWSVWHGREDMEAYLSIKPRFVSEFGFESFPSLEGIREFAPEEALNLTSPVLEYHQRSPSGNSIILENFSRYFRFPSGTEQMLYLSQVQQALAVKTAVAYWRSLRPHCMGACYWQLNDVWPVTSWSSLEYSGKWKLLHYAARRFFAPLSLSLIQKDGGILASVVNETTGSADISVTIAFIGFDGTEIAAPVTVRRQLASDNAEYVWQQDVENLPLIGGDKERTGYFILATMRSGAEEQRDVLFVRRWKKYELPRARITAQVSEKDGQLSVTLRTDRPAFYVSVEAAGIPGIFSDNMLILLPGTETVLSFTPSSYGWQDAAPAPSAQDLQAALRIMSLRDSYD